MSKKIRELRDFIENNEISYNQANKDVYKRKSVAVFKIIGKLLELKELKVHYNPGGIAVGGDTTLIGMWENQGIYISYSPDRFDANHLGILYRTVKHMKDYSGGTNNWMPFDELLDLDEAIEKFKRVGRDF